MSRIFYPRCLVRFTALLNMSRTADVFRQVSDTVIPRSVTIVRTSYNEADTAELEFDVQRFPILPRMIRQVFCSIYAGDARSNEDPYATNFAESDDLLRFVGYIDDPEMSLSETDGTVRWKLRDFTAELLADKRPAVGVVPSYGDNLQVALRRILDSLPGGANIKLELVGLSEWPEMSLVAPPALKNAKVPVKPDDTAWHLVKRCCDPHALIPRISLDKLIVSTSRGLQTPAKRAVFVYGSGIIDYKEKRQTGRSQEGIGLTGYLAATRQPIEALWPPAGDPAVNKPGKKLTKKTGTPDLTGTEEKRFWTSYGVAASEAALLNAAKELYTQRARQEFEGQFSFGRMRVVDDTLPNDASDDDATYDVMSLENGDRVWIAIEPDMRQLLAGITSPDARVQFLIDHGYASDIAPVLVDVFELNVGGALECYVRRASHTISEEGYTLQCDFNNILTIPPAAT